MIEVVKNKYVLAGAVLSGLSAVGYVLSFEQAMEIAVPIGVIITQVVVVLGLVKKLKKKSDTKGGTE